jgi:ABC-type phosphate transport system permease subunit
VKHTCHHIGTLPETLPPFVREEMQKREKQETNTRDFLVAVAVIAALLLIAWIFSLFVSGIGTPEP